MLYFKADFEISSQQKSILTNYLKKKYILKDLEGKKVRVAIVIPEMTNKTIEVVGKVILVAIDGIVIEAESTGKTLNLFKENIESIEVLE